MLCGCASRQPLGTLVVTQAESVLVAHTSGIGYRHNPAARDHRLGLAGDCCRIAFSGHGLDRAHSGRRPRGCCCGDTGKKAFLVGVPCMLAANAFYSRDPSPPLGWIGIDTNFAHSHSSHPLAAYTRMQSIQALVRASNANVLIFPESIVEDWTEATDLFWEETTQLLRGSGRTVLVGATAPVQRLSQPAHGLIDFPAELSALRGTGVRPESLGNLGAGPIMAPAGPYRNSVMLRGAQVGASDQRVPVPIGMWKPLTSSGVPLKLLGSGTVPARRQAGSGAHLL